MGRKLYAFYVYISVSYTHLDVYKRQGHGNARDIAADEGTPIYAAMSGIVKDVVMIYDNHMNWNPAYKTGIPSMSSGMQSYGNYIDILLWDGTTIRYAHQQQSSFVKKRCV